MAEPLKHMYNVAFFEELCPVMTEVIPSFDCRAFIHYVFDNRWPDLELKQRVTHIAQALHNFMPKHFPEAAKIIVSLSEKLRLTGTREQGFATMFLPEYIHLYGLDFPEESLDALEEITKLVSAEFAIRPFLLQDLKGTLQRMKRWSKHEHASVRRLASEGCRPRLPWAMGVPILKKDATLILPIIENLKRDSSEYVRRSVANNLNDIAKDHPKMVLGIAQQWLGKDDRTNWIIRHGCRTLLKKGNQEALIMQGFNPKSRSKLQNFSLSKTKIKVGDRLPFEFTFVSLEKTTCRFRLEYAIDYLTSTGKTSTKIFKITESEYAPGAQVQVHRKPSFQNYTTRKHYKGKHSIAILVNGKKMATKEFVIC